jgi:hypothetical protein
MDPLRAALRSLFNSELHESLAILKGCVATHPNDPLAASLSAAVPFYHFVGGRLRPHGHASMAEMIVGKGIGAPADVDHIGSLLQRARTGRRRSDGRPAKPERAAGTMCS